MFKYCPKSHKKYRNAYSAKHRLINIQNISTQQIRIFLLNFKEMIIYSYCYKIYALKGLLKNACISKFILYKKFYKDINQLSSCIVYYWRKIFLKLDRDMQWQNAFCFNVLSSDLSFMLVYNFKFHAYLFCSKKNCFTFKDRNEDI